MFLIFFTNYWQFHNGKCAHGELSIHQDIPRSSARCVFAITTPLPWHLFDIYYTVCATYVSYRAVNAGTTLRCK